MRLVAHLQRLHFAFHDHAQTGQLMANANTDIQQIHLVVLLIPLTIASVLTMIAVVDRAGAAQSRSRALRARGVAALEHRRDSIHAPHVSRRPGVAGGACRAVRRRRGERRRCARREGLRCRAVAEAQPRDRSRRRLRALDRPGATPRELPAADRPPADARSRGHPLVRRPSGARRQPVDRRRSSRRTSTC